MAYIAPRAQCLGNPGLGCEWPSGVNAPLALQLTIVPWDRSLTALAFSPVSSFTPVPSGDVRNALLASPKVSTILVDDLTDKLTTARRQDLDSLR